MPLAAAPEAKGTKCLPVPRPHGHGFLFGGVLCVSDKTREDLVLNVREAANNNQREYMLHRLWEILILKRIYPSSETQMQWASHCLPGSSLCEPGSRTCLCWVRFLNVVWRWAGWRWVTKKWRACSGNVSSSPTSLELWGGRCLRALGPGNANLGLSNSLTYSYTPYQTNLTQEMYAWPWGLGWGTGGGCEVRVGLPLALLWSPKSQGTGCLQGVAKYTYPLSSHKISYLVNIESRGTLWFHSLFTESWY